MFEEKFQGDLQKNQRILWTGRPRQGFSLQREIFNYWLLGAAAIAISIEAFSPDATPFWQERFRDWSWVDLRTAFYLAVGAWFMLAPPIIERIRKPWVYYAVTNQRVVILFEYGRRTIRSLIITATPKFEMEAGGEDRGTLRFGGAGKRPYMESPSAMFAWEAIISSV